MYDPGAAADGTAARVALWRALHVEIDAAPHVLEDTLGLRLLAPQAGWRRQGDMHPLRTRRSRASVVARARFVEDEVTEAQNRRGVVQYVILGAGLDTFAQRKPDMASRLRVFELDRPQHQAWKRRRLIEEGLGIPSWLHFVPVDFDAGDSWREGLAAAGFDGGRPAVIASTGVSMYLTREAIAATLAEAASLAQGTTLIMSFMLPPALAAPSERAGLRQAEKGARARGTPFVSLLAPAQALALATEAGFKKARCVGPQELYQRYFADRTDDLRPSSAEELLVASN
ncbi:class I SAM-dependent methyltransferase [Xylophilus sp.]|uniref:class I SAM-dependent methyltransferase n=1 Tax=Xylophilus sp. TaxID=2653893 RepID=UPI003FCEAE81